MLDSAENEPDKERVTLKKEIGLLSACAIIIGEYPRAEGTVSATSHRL